MTGWRIDRAVACLLYRESELATERLGYWAYEVNELVNSVDHGRGTNKTLLNKPSLEHIHVSAISSARPFLEVLLLFPFPFRVDYW